MAATKKMTEKQARNLISKTYTESCSGISIDMMDISKIFAEGHKALAEGRDLKTAIVAFVETIRKDKPAQATA
jgi:hypothetical protein